MSFQDKFRALLQEIQEKDLPVLVEGKKDQKTLQKLGLGNIITLKKPLYQVVEELAAPEIVILTDLDRAGRQLYRKLYHDCVQRGIKVNNRLRLFLLQETPLAHIEGLDTYLENSANK